MYAKIVCFTLVFVTCEFAEPPGSVPGSIPIGPYSNLPSSDQNNIPSGQFPNNPNNFQNNNIPSGQFPNNSNNFQNNIPSGQFPNNPNNFQNNIPSAQFPNNPNNFQNNIQSGQFPNNPNNFLNNKPSGQFQNNPNNLPNNVPVNQKPNFPSIIQNGVPIIGQFGNFPSNIPNNTTSWWAQFLSMLNNAQNNGQVSNQPNNLQNTGPAVIPPIPSNAQNVKLLKNRCDFKLDATKKTTDAPGQVSNLPNAAQNLPSNLPNNVQNDASVGQVSNLPNTAQNLPSNLPNNVQNALPIGQGQLSGLTSNTGNSVPLGQLGNLPSGVQNSIPFGQITNLPNNEISNVPLGLPSVLPSNVQSNIFNAPSSIPDIPNAPNNLQSLGGQVSSIPTSVGGLPVGGQLPSIPSSVGALPAGGLPTGGLPTGGVPAGSLPTGGVPAGSLPTGGVPAGGLPTGGVPAGGQLPNSPNGDQNNMWGQLLSFLTSMAQNSNFGNTGSQGGSNSNTGSQTGSNGNTGLQSGSSQNILGNTGPQSFNNGNSGSQFNNNGNSGSQYWNSAQSNIIFGPGTSSGNIPYTYRVGPNDDERNIERPCHVSFTECIKQYFAQHAKCKESYGPVPDPLIRAVSTSHLPSINLTLSATDAIYSGLNGNIEDFYVNKASDKLVITIQFRNVTLYSKDTFYTYHRRGREPVVNVDHLFLNFRSVSTTTTIPCIDDLQFDKSETFAYVDDASPRYSLGPNAFVSSDRGTQAVFPALIASISANIQEFFLTEGAFLAASFIQHSICDFGYEVL